MNEYGLDVNYFKGKLKLILRDCDRYTPREMETELDRLSSVATQQHRAQKRIPPSGFEIVNDENEIIKSDWTILEPCHLDWCAPMNSSDMKIKDAESKFLGRGWMFARPIK